ncbi:Papilin [Trichinella pseudospiralis]|uniref:Papilin n=1 Tax=Trichinella pseudospiralis TaxID=6337 RepID=A0A0V0XEZ7_TRIPS|nr:Papilin [Trichinella pseudospiralis]
MSLEAFLKIVDYSLLCRDGAPQLSDGKPLHCFSDADCMVGYWCHIGSSRITTYCCPNALADYGCNLPRLSGHGTGRMERWYHDVKLGGCQKFFYTGYGGNQNNFLTKDQCPPVFDSHPKLPYPAGMLNVVDKSLTSTMGFNFNPASWTYPFATYPALPKVIQPPKPQIPTPIMQTTPRPKPIPNHTNVQNLNAILNSHQSTVQSSTVPQAPYVIQRPPSGNGGQKVPESVLQNLQPYPSGNPVYTSDQQSISELQATWPLYMVQQPSKPQISSVYTLPKEPMPFPKPSVNTPAPGTTAPAVSSEESVLSNAGQPLSVHPLKQTVDFDERCLQPKMISAVNNNISGGSSSELQWTFDALIGQCQPVMIHHQSIEPIQTLNVFSSQFECNFYCNPAAYRPVSEGKGIGELVGDPCQLPLSTGQGYNLDVRWAYDQTADQCRTFLFFGFGGNANNFETEMECMAACSSQRYQFPDVLLSNQLIAGEQQYGFLQPDIRHQPISQQSILVCNGLKKINEVELCDQHNNYQCPDGQLCNYNATISVCCPIAVDHHQLDHYPSECFLPLDLGQGSRPLVRWYFDQISGRCQEFLYRGSNGNMNNFESSDECRAFCERKFFHRSHEFSI